uniref:MAM domain containing glycosylphosphatidylinositol anchor 2a n=1 Tax=Sphaeramia orbicularis TaxID=375764 RepID=A0A673B5Q4_9TELE
GVSVWARCFSLVPVFQSAPPTVRIVHSGQACNVEEEKYSERVYTIREGETLELQCLVTGHPRPQIRWTKTAGGASDRQGDQAPHNDTLKIQTINRHQGGRYYCKAENGLGSPAIKSIRVDVYCKDTQKDTKKYTQKDTKIHTGTQKHTPTSPFGWASTVRTHKKRQKYTKTHTNNSIRGETKILKLKNLRPQDYSDYTCVASVRSVCAIDDKSAHFSLSNRTAPPSIKLLLDDPLVVNPGETVSLVCVASGGDPPPTLMWIRPEGEELPKRSVVNRGTLTIPAVTVDDGGVYSCVASNNVGNSAKKSTTVLVRGMNPGRFWITPDPYHNDDNIQIGREVKISCQVEATPPEELAFGWLKNGRPLRSSERMVITHTDTDVTPGTTNLDIIDLKFTDFGTYTCVASLRNGGSPEISIDVNISSTTVPPELTVPRGRSHLVAQEGDTVDLQCLVSGKPKPIILWSRVEEGGGAAATGHTPMPDGSAQMESYDGVLRISNVTRDMGGTYRCQTSQYNGFNVKPREALIQLVVQFPPTVEPVYTEIRQALGRAFSLTCRLLRAHPARLLRYEWKLGSRLLTVGQFGEQKDDTNYHVRALNREGYGEYTCDITNEAGAGRCTFLVTGKAYAPEFYYDTYGALWQNRPRVYGFKLQWTQMEPNAVDRIVAYRLGIRQQEITMDRTIQKGELLTYNLTELVKPESYLVRLTPITHYGEGDTTERIITYTPVNPHLREFQCGFEDEALCLFSQDKTEEFDWTRHSAATRDTKYTPNTGPSSDHAGSKQGFYMYIETSRPRLEGDKARLLSPTFNMNTKTSSLPGGVAPTYCVSFYYHMYGKHIGKKTRCFRALNVFLLSGNQGNRWRQAKVNIHPTMVLEGVRWVRHRGDIAIDDIAIEEGECKDPPPRVSEPPENT